MRLLWTSPHHLKYVEGVWHARKRGVSDVALMPESDVGDAMHALRRLRDAYRERVETTAQDAPSLILESDIAFRRAEDMLARWDELHAQEDEQRDM